MVVVMDPAADSDDILRQNRSKDRKYAFDHAFGPETGQEELYMQTTQVRVPQWCCWWSLCELLPWSARGCCWRCCTPFCSVE
jgi:hypothetical protein